MTVCSCRTINERNHQFRSVDSFSIFLTYLRRCHYLSRGGGGVGGGGGGGGGIIQFLRGNGEGDQSLPNENKGRDCR